MAIKTIIYSNLEFLSGFFKHPDHGATQILNPIFNLFHFSSNENDIFHVNVSLESREKNQ